MEKYDSIRPGCEKNFKQTKNLKERGLPGTIEQKVLVEMSTRALKKNDQTLCVCV